MSSHSTATPVGHSSHRRGAITLCGGSLRFCSGPVLFASGGPKATPALLLGTIAERTKVFLIILATVSA